MDTFTVSPSGIKGLIKAPPSGNETVRAIAAAMMSPGLSLISNPSLCDDALLALDIAATLGAEVKWEQESVLIRGNGSFQEWKPLKSVIYCGESGLCVRMFAPIAALTGAWFTIDGLDAIAGKPMQNLEKLRAFGVICETNNGFAPIWLRGKLKSGSLSIDGPYSSQMLTGLLMALPLCKGESSIKISPTVNERYIEVTLRMLKRFGIVVSRDKTGKIFNIQGHQNYKANNLTIEGDWSLAAFLLIVGATAGSINVSGLNVDSDQAEKAVLHALERAGAKVEILNGSVSVKQAPLNSFAFDAGSCPALVLPLAALAVHCKGRSVIYGVEYLRLKESTRIQGLVTEFSRLGVKIDVYKDRLEIQGGKVQGAVVDSHNDYRVAMACAVAAVRGEGDVVIENSGCISKSYPTFFEDLDTVRIHL